MHMYCMCICNHMCMVYIYIYPSLSPSPPFWHNEYQKLNVWEARVLFIQNNLILWVETILRKHVSSSFIHRILGDSANPPYSVSPIIIDDVLCRRFITRQPRLQVGYYGLFNHLLGIRRPASVSCGSCLFMLVRSCTVCFVFVLV